jgi:spore coat protein U-like protein
MQKRRSIGLVVAMGLAGLLWLLASAPANAAAVCTLSSAGVAFGTFSGSQVTASGTIDMNCTGSGTSSFNLKLSTGAAGTYSPRHMTSGANNLNYNVYTDAAHTIIWGDGTGGTSIYNPGSNTLKPPQTFSIPIYGLLPAQASPASGSYTDTLTVTITCTNGGACTNTGTVPITAGAQPTCSITATNLAFGAYNQVQLDATSTLSATCASGASYNIGLNQGGAPGATVTTRGMTGPGGLVLKYSLFRDSARTINWGNTVGTDTVAATGTGSAQSFTVYGRIPASQNLGGGVYQDTITATLTF